MQKVACRYCTLIKQHDSRYPERQARHSLDSSYPRCDIHWRYTCSLCGKAKHFDGVAYCPRDLKFYCIGCAPEHRAARLAFWGWSYYFRLRCPWHGEWHAALDRLEYERRHPWQLDGSMRRARAGMSRSEEIAEPWHYRVLPLKGIKNRDVRKGWDDAASWWISRYGPRGDMNREWVIDPVIFRYLGDVKRLRVLDAGCGGGYMARILARRGATVHGVDISPRLIEMAWKEEAKKPLGVRYRRGDIANLSFFSDGTFDRAVCNITLQDTLRYRKAVKEIYRVLKKGGRFVFCITHPAFEAPVPGRWVREPADTERTEMRYRAVDRYFDRVAVFWSESGQPEVMGFHRPLRDFFEALHNAGFLVSRLEEPLPGAKAVERYYRQFADNERIPFFMVIEAVKLR